MSVSQPAIVLVHGAWADASSWNSVIPELQQRGFTVYAPPNPLAKRAGARITDVDAGHLSLISEAPVVTRVILEAVQATG